MTDDEIHKIYLHISGKAEGIAEITGTADFPVLFARAILELNHMEQKPTGFMDSKRNPIKREWQGLTNEDINEIHSEIKAKGMGSYKTEDIYRAIDAKLKEKNHE